MSTALKEPSNPAPANRVFVTAANKGCVLSLNENQLLEHYYSTKANAITETADTASKIVINTCAATTETENESLDLISYYTKKYPEKEVVVTGCLPKINPKSVRKSEDVTLVNIDDITEELKESGEQAGGYNFANSSVLKKFPFRVKFIFALRTVLNFFEHIHLPILDQKMKNIFAAAVVNPEYRYILASKGCKSNCTFCVIKKSKGSLKSRPLAEIETEIQALANDGEKSFWLLGDDLGCWGKDINLTLYNLLEKVLKISTVENVVLGNLDPTYLVEYGDSLVQPLADKKIQLLNIPIQSGSNRVLELMKRNHPIEKTVPLLNKIREINRNVILKTNVIVGFPTETWSDFFATMKVLPEFDISYVMIYSERPNSGSVEITPKIPYRIGYIRKVLMDLYITYLNTKKVLFSILRIQY